jgi:hypothetical protein
MAQYDIRFAKKINRIQQSIIQELNKMAMVHLYLLGYTGEDLNSFQLTLTNPSIQGELLKSELLRERAQTYTELTRSEGGIAAMSHTNAKRLIFNMSDRQIVEDLKQQKMEMVIKQELVDSPVQIKKTGLFADIDKRFAEPEGAIIGAPTGGTDGGMPPTGGDMGGLPASGGAAGLPPTTGGDMGGMPPAGGDMGGLPPVAEGRLSEEDFGKHLERTVFGNSIEPEHKKEIENKKIINENNEKNDKLNSNANIMIEEIGVLLKNSASINSKQKENIAEDINIEDIESIDLTE